MNWLDLEPDEQLAVLETVSDRQGREPVVLEKDLWVVWALGAVFALGGPDLPMAFKGGTSLSKAYGLITRFSEDLDITLGLLGKSGSAPQDLAALSNNKRKRAVEALQGEAQTLVLERLLPHLQASAAGLDRRVEVGVEGEAAKLKLSLRYPTVLPVGATYIQRRVLLEFGGKNPIEPHERRTIRTYLSEEEDVRGQVRLPEATVEVLDARRTFWEKLTAVHVACQQPGKLERLHGFSWHLLDLHVLMGSAVGPDALENTRIRDDVIETKSVLYRETGVIYDDYRTGRATLVPEGVVREALESDHEQMANSGMFGVERVPFGEVLATLRKVQDRLNGG